MKFVSAFLKFWYDFFIGDAWELAAGAVIVLLLAALLVNALSGVIWLLFPLAIFAVLSISVLRYAHKSSH